MGYQMRIRVKKSSSGLVAEAAPVSGMAFRPECENIPSAPTVVGSMARHRLVVLVGTVVVAAGAVGYTYGQPKSYSATAMVSMVQPTDNQALGTQAAASPQQYVESQVLVLESQPVAVRAATLANRSLGGRVFTPGDFSGPHSKVKVTTQTSIDPNSGLVTVAYSAARPEYAAAGANSLLRAYVNAQQAAVNQTYASMTQVIDAALTSVDSQLQSLAGKPAALQNQLAASLVAQRTDLLQRRSLVAIDQQAALTSTPSVVQAYTPSSASNRKLTKVVPIGAVVGFVLAALLAYGIESRRRRRALRKVTARSAETSGQPSPDEWQSGWDMAGMPATSEIQSS